MNDYVASSGTLVSAALQTAGYYYQSLALDALTTPFKGLYFLVYLTAAACAAAAFVTTGKVKNIRWFLLGPIFFAILLNERVVTTGTEWRYGTKVYNEAMVRQRVATMVTQPLYEPRVSKVFAKFDAIISRAMQGMIAILMQTRQSADLKLLVRADLYGFMMNRELTDPGLRELVHASLLGGCAEMISAGREMADLRISPRSRCESAKQYQRYALAPQIQVSEATARFLGTMQVLHPALYQAQGAYNLDNELARFQTDITSRGGTACALPSTGSVVAARIDVSNLADTAARQDIAEFRNQVVRSSADVDRARAALAGREAEVDTAAQAIRLRGYSCHDIWNLTYKGLHYEAARAKESAKGIALDQGLNEAEIMRDLSSFTGQVGEDQLVRGIARKLFRNESQVTPTSALIAQYSQAGTNIAQLGVPGDNAVYTTEKGVTQMREYAAKYKLLSVAASLPYYQGMFLYFLAIVFPFFSMLLLIPGRFSAFFIWFGLWIWLKSWDVGFAVAGFIDDALFAIFTSRFSDPVAATDQTLSPSFSIAVEALRDIDPSFNLGTYYNIMAMVLMTIPFVTAQIMMVSVQSSSNLIEQGVSTLAMASGLGAFRMGAQGSLDSLRHATYEERLRAGVTGMETGTAADGGINSLNSPYTRNFGMESQPLRGGLTPREALSGPVPAAYAAEGLSGGFGDGIRFQGFAISSVTGAAGTLAGQAARGIQGVEDAHLKALEAWTSKKVDDTYGRKAGRSSVETGASQGYWGADDGAFVQILNEQMVGIGEAVRMGGAALEATTSFLPSGKKISSRNSGLSGVTMLGVGTLLGGMVGSSPAGDTDPDDGLPTRVGEIEPFHVPVAGSINSAFGAARRAQNGGTRGHAGIDIGSSAAPDVRPAASGKVLYAGEINGYGNTVIIQHDSKTFTLYGHLRDRSLNVSSGSQVAADEVIGLVGDTGNAHVAGKDNAHLHFEVIQLEYESDGKGGYRPVFYQLDPTGGENGQRQRISMNPGMSKLMLDSIGGS